MYIQICIKLVLIKIYNEIKVVREATKKVLFLMAGPLRGGGEKGPLRKNKYT